MKGRKVLWRQAPMVKVNSDFFVAHNGHRLGWHRFSDFAFECSSQNDSAPTFFDVQHTVSAQIERRRSIKIQEFLAQHFGRFWHILISKYCNFSPKMTIIRPKICADTVIQEQILQVATSWNSLIFYSDMQKFVFLLK